MSCPYVGKLLRRASVGLRKVAGLRHRLLLLDVGSGCLLLGFHFCRGPLGLPRLLHLSPAVKLVFNYSSFELLGALYLRGS